MTPRAYVLDRDVLLQKIRETVALGGDQILMQGGLHPDLPFEWYEDLLRDIKAHFPTVNVHGFSPPEIHHFHEEVQRRMPLSPRPSSSASRRPGSGASPAAAARSWSIASARR